MYHIKADKRNITTSELVIHALDDLINEMNFDQISIKLLVNRAGIGRATFYRSFDALDDVLLYQTDLQLKHLFDWIFTALNKKRNFTDQDVMLTFFSFWSQNIDLPEKLIIAKRYWILERAFNNFLQSRLTFLKTILHLPANEWRYFVRIRKVVLMGMLEEWIIGGCQESSEELVQILGKTSTNIQINWDLLNDAQMEVYSNL
ncbi:MAG: TetR/AcrR family transcriptional regulator [Anaerolineaceae bacterium]|nr:TetR/AcrR family transcriptional regulator [Anaerolineaceae bacterium]